MFRSESVQRAWYTGVRGQVIPNATQEKVKLNWLLDSRFFMLCKACTDNILRDPRQTSLRHIASLGFKGPNNASPINGMVSKEILQRQRHSIRFLHGAMR